MAETLIISEIETKLVNKINEMGKKYMHIRNIKELLPITINDSGLKIDMLVGDIEFFTKDTKLLNYATKLLKLKERRFGDL